MKFFAMDIGSTYLKTALLDCDTKTITMFPERSMPKAFTGADSLSHEIDAEGLYNTVKNALDACIAKEKNAVSGVLISTQMHGFMFCSKEGQPHTPYISWQDNRCLREKEPGISYLDYLKSIISPEMMASHGLYLKPGLGFCNAYTAIREKKYNIEDGWFSMIRKE